MKRFRFFVLALLVLGMIGGASADTSLGSPDRVLDSVEAYNAETGNDENNINTMSLNGDKLFQTNDGDYFYVYDYTKNGGTSSEILNAQKIDADGTGDNFHWSVLPYDGSWYIYSFDSSEMYEYTFDDSTNSLTKVGLAKDFSSEFTRSQGSTICENDHMYFRGDDASDGSLDLYRVDPSNSFSVTNLGDYSYQDGLTCLPNGNLLVGASGTDLKEIYPSNQSVVETYTTSGLATRDRGIHLDKENGDLILNGEYDGDGIDEALVWEKQFIFNQIPQFNSSSINPDPPLIGDTADFSYTASDPDGSISSVELVLKDDGTQVFTGSKSSATGTFSPPDKLTQGDIIAEFTATDDAGATTKKTLTRTLTDTKPVVNVSQPSGTSFDYDQSIRVNTKDDGDNKANEQLSCSLELDGSQIDQRTVTEGDSYTVNTRSDLGSHSVNVTCTEQDDQQSDSGSTSFTVENFKFQSLSGASSGKETTQQSFTGGFKAGDMVNNVSFDLVYDSQVRDQETVNVSGVTDSSQGFSHVLNLAQTDGVNRDYNVTAEVDYDNLNSGTSTDNVDSSTNTQTVNQAFSYNKSVLEDGLTQLEASTLDFEAQVNKDVNNDRADLSAESTLQQTGETRTLEQNGLNFTGIFDTDLINSTTTTTNLDTTVTVSFNGETRNFTNTDTLTLEKIQLSKSSSTGPKTLQFETRDEINNSLLDANVEAGITVNNPDQPDKTRFFGFDFTKDKKHELFLSPSDATVTANVFEERSIAYENLDAGFPGRRHYLTDTTLDNETTNINLYLLEQTKGQTVRLELTNSDLQGLSNHLIRVERAFPDQNETRTVQLAKTGTEGFASSFLQLQERYIFTVFDENGDLVDQVGPETVTTSDKRIQVNDNIDPSLANVLNEVQFTDIQRGNQSLSVSYVSETQRLNNLFLKISSDGLFETKTLDVDSSEQPQGQLEVNDFNASEQKVFFELIGTFGETNLTLESGTFGQESNDFGNAGIFVSFLMFTALTLSGLFRPSAAIGLGVISIFVMSFTGFLAVGQQALISIAALAAVLIWRMSSQ